MRHAAVDEGLLGSIPLAALPPGTCTFLLAAASAGGFDSFYLWATLFMVP